MNKYGNSVAAGSAEYDEYSDLMGDNIENDNHDCAFCPEYELADHVIIYKAKGEQDYICNCCLEGFKEEEPNYINDLEIKSINPLTF